MDLNIRILTPQKRFWDRQPVSKLTLPTPNGEIGILPNHAPLITTLDIGILRTKIPMLGRENTIFKNFRGLWASVVIMSGFAEIQDNKITIFCNEAEDARSISYTEATANLKNAILLVKMARTKKEKIEATRELTKCIIRVKAVSV